MRIALAAAVLAATAAPAEAKYACATDRGWAIAPGSTVPPRAHLVYFVDGNRARPSEPPKLTATIGGKPVAVKVALIPARPYVLVAIDIDSDRRGELIVIWLPPDPASEEGTSARFVVGAPRSATRAKVQLSAFREPHPDKLHHEDYVQIAVDQPAVMFTGRWRRDATSAWQKLALAAATVDDRQVARVGELACDRSLNSDLLDAGIELELAAVLDDGRAVPLALPRPFTRGATP